MRTLAGVAVLIGLSFVDVCPAVAAGCESSPTSPTTVVSGMAMVDLRDHTGADIQYNVRINAVEDPEDGFQGSVSSVIKSGDGTRVIVLSKVTCVLVSHNSAWISSVVTLSTNDALYSPGDVLMTHVRDFGAVGDVLHQEAVRNLPAVNFDIDGDGDVDCHDRPALYPSTVSSGDIVIK
jgi:hypothetical protein